MISVSHDTQISRRTEILAVVIVGIVWSSVLSPAPNTEAQQSSNDVVVRFGYLRSVFSDVNINDATAALKVWGGAIARRRRVCESIQPLVFDDLGSLKQAIHGGGLDFVIVPTPRYFEIQESVVGDELLVSEHSGRCYEEYLVVVHRDMEKRDLAALQGGTLVFLNTGRSGELAAIWMSTILARQGLPNPEQFFSRITTVAKPSRALLPVFFKQADAALVMRSTFETMSELNPQIGRRLAVVASSTPLLPSVLTPTHNLDPELRRRISQVLLELHLEPDGSQVLLTFKADRLLPCDKAWLDGVKSLMDECEALRGSSFEISMTHARSQEANPEDPGNEVKAP